MPTVSDAFVFFGATGDLAYKKIFPALQAMIQRGDLDMPIIGMARAGWTLEQLRERGARQPRAQRRRRRRTRSPSCRLAAAVRRRRLQRSRHLRAAAARRWAAQRVRCTTSRFRRACSGPSCRASPQPAAPRTRASSSRSRSAATWRRRRRSTARCTRCSPSRRSSASTTTSARKRCRTCSISASPTRSSSRSGTATTSTACRSRWPRTSACEGRGGFYEEVGAIRDVVQNHLLQVMALLAMDAPVGRDPECDARREAAPVPRDAAARPAGGRARPVPRLSRRSRASPPDSHVETFAALRLHIDTWRWAGVPFYIRAGKCLPVTATEVMRRPEDAAGGDLRRDPAGAIELFRFRLSPEVVISAGARVKRPGEAMVGDAVELVARHQSRAREIAVRAAAGRRDARRRLAVHARRRRRGGVARRRSGPRQRRRPSTTTSPAPGGRPAARAWSPATKAGTIRSPRRRTPC